MTPSKRTRRTPEEARRLILDAAEACMARAGPAGLRLQEVAEIAGVTHPTVLHHFQSREGLIRALNGRSLESLRETLMAAMAGRDRSAGAAEATFAAFREGLAQRMLWVIQSTPMDPAAALPIFEEMVDQLQAVRERLAGPGESVDREDTRAMIHLTVVAAFGDAIIGARLRRAGSAEADREGAEGFAAWFARLLGREVG